MPRDNTRASYIDVTLHQAARRDALLLGQAAREEQTDPSMTTFLWAMVGILCSLILVLWAVR